MALVRFFRTILTLADKLLLSAGSNLDNPGNRHFDPEIAVPVYNRFPWPFRRKRLRDFMPKAIVMAMTFVIVSLFFAGTAFAAATINTTTGTVAAMTTTYGTASATKQFTVGGTTVTGAILVTPPVGYGVSTAPAGPFTASVTVGAAGTFAPVTIYICILSTTSAGTIATANIVCSGGGAPNKNISQPASTVNKLAITETGATASNKPYDGTTTATVSGGVLVGVLAGDVGNVSVSTTGTFASANVATNIVVTLALTGSAAANYTLTTPVPNVTANITALSITVTATGPLKTFGTPLTTGTSTTNFTSSGTFATGQAVTSVTLTPDNAGKDNPTNTPVGNNYVVTPSLATGSGGFLASNYTITYVAYTGTVTGAVLTITAVSPASQVYGSVTIPTPTVTYSGFITGDSQASMILLPTVTNTATSTSNAGAYPITVTGAQAPAYYTTVNQVSGTFTITPAPLTITATGPAETAGTTPSPNPTTYTTNFVYSGAVNGETVTSVTMAISPTTLGGSGSTYTVQPSAATGSGGFLASNYTITYTAYTGTCENTYTWTGATNTTWSTNTNWSSNVTPGTNDNVIIPNTARSPVVTTSTAVSTLAFTGNESITVNNGIVLTVNKAFSVPSGVNASIILSNTSSQLTIGTAGTSANFNNAGNFQVQGGVFTVIAGNNYIYNSGTFTAYGGNSFHITGNGTTANTAIYNVGNFYVGTNLTNALGESACALTFDDSQSILNESGGNFYVGPTSSMLYFNTSAHNCNVTNQSGATFTFQSDQNGSGCILAIPGTTNAFIGTFTVERYVSAQRGYRLIASPVNSGSTDANGNKLYSLNYVQNSAYITGSSGYAGGFDSPTKLNPTLYLYREDVPVLNSSFIDGNYQGINNLNSGTNTPPTYTFDYTSTTGSYSIPISNGFLFFFRGNNNAGTVAQETVTTWPATAATMSTSGNLNTGQVIFRDWYTPSSALLGRVNGNVAAQGFNLVANPYACTIDWETLQNTTSTTGIYYKNLSTYVWELNPTTKNYDTYQKGGTFTNHGSRYIVSGQGFFVDATTAAAQLNLNETAKVTVATQNTGSFLLMGQPLAAIPNIQTLRLQMAKDSINTDDMLISFNDNSKAVFDVNEDAIYKVGLGEVSLSSLSSDNVPLAINWQPLVHKGQTIGVNVNAAATGAYKLSLTEVKGVPQLYDVWLKDNFSKDSVNLRVTNSYAFTITKTDTNTFGSNRFALSIRQDTAYAYRLLTFNAQKVPNARAVQVAWTTKYEENYTNFTVEKSTDNGATYNVIGGVSAAASGSYGLVDTHPVNGLNLYRLKSEDINNVITYSKVIPIGYSDQSGKFANSNLNVFPNPASSNINLVVLNDLNNAESYNIMITNSLGFVMKKGTSAQPNWQASVSDLLPGTYLVKVFNNKDQSLVGTTKFVKL